MERDLDEIYGERVRVRVSVLFVCPWAVCTVIVARGFVSHTLFLGFRTDLIWVYIGFFRNKARFE